MRIEEEVLCPKCEGILLDDQEVELGEIVTCEECGAELEITALDPEVKFEDAPSVQEDWGE